MEFVCLGSSSAGNCYLFKEGDKSVIVECGFKIADITKKLHSYNSTLGEIEAVITTHGHGDHSKAIPDFNKFNIKKITPWVDKDYGHFIPVCNWLDVYCFPVVHDVDACGFFFFNKITKESVLFVNDTKCFELPNDLKHLSYDFIFIECNHIRKQLEMLIKESITKGDKGKLFKYERQAEFHLSLAGTKKFLNQLNLKNTKGIFLMHLSKEVSNHVIMRDEIRKHTGKPTFVCMRDGGLF